VARFTFHALLIPLIYSTTASSVSPSSVQNYWFVLVMAFAVMLISYFSATLLQVCFRVHPRDYQSLRISCTFPNVVALPILIFPSLCEYTVVQRGYFGKHQGGTIDPYQQCVSVSNTMIFCYFFSWSLAFWTFGYPRLVQSAADNVDKPMTDESDEDDDDSGGEVSSGPAVIDSHQAINNVSDLQFKVSTVATFDEETDAPKATIYLGRDAMREDAAGKEAKGDHSEVTVHESSASTPLNVPPSRWSACCTTFHQTAKQILLTPPFWALALGFVTGCILPLKNALYSQGGVLRFIGSALESLGQASSPISTLVVAASLVPEPDGRDDARNSVSDASIPEESPIMSDPNHGPYQLRRRSSLALFRQSVQTSTRVLLGRSNPELRKQLIWFTLSRLLLAPALTTAAMVGLDCGGLLQSVPGLAKAVILVNSCVPGALIIVVVLKQREELAETAAVVARVYLPTYLISIVTLSGWTALALWLTLSDENGLTFCERR
jgi:predicted permease